MKKHLTRKTANNIIRQETRDKRQETRDKRQETRDSFCDVTNNNIILRNLAF